MARKTKMNSITTPELLSKVNPDNIQLKNEFLDYLRSIKRSPGTCAGYDSDLQIFFVWVLQHANNKSFTKISKRDLVAYQNWLINENQNSPARVRRLKASISSLSNFVEAILDEEDEFKGFRSIVRKIENPALQPVREKTVWEENELESLLNKLINDKQFEKACYLALAMYSGRRKAELARFKVSDFDDNRLVCDGALYKSAPIKTKGKGGGKFIPCYTLAKRFRPYLEYWLRERKEKGIESEWLFPHASDPNEHVHISTLNSWAMSFSKITGKDFYTHSLRHFFTTYLSREGLPDSVITQIVGWESADMCKLYNDADSDEQIGAYFKNGDIATTGKKTLSDL